MLTLLSLLGGGLGGILRLVPEILKMFSEGKDRDHEFRMTELQLQIDKARAAHAIDAIHAAGDETVRASEMSAYIEAIKAQGQVTGDKWLDRVNMSVRPFVTYWWMILFTIYKLATIGYVLVNWIGFDAFLMRLWTADDAAILSMILGFWFVDRAVRKPR